MSGYLLAVDAGIGGGRCVAFDTDGRIVAKSCAEWGYEYPRDIPGGVEFSAQRFWTLLTSVVRDTVGRLDGGAGAVLAVSATCMREGFVLLDEVGRELYAAPPFDERGAAQNAALADEIGDAVYERTGHWPASLHAPGRLLWLQEHRPQLWKEVASLLMIGDWVLFRLTGERAGEPSNLCSTVLFDVAAREWADDLLDRVGVGREILPPVRMSGEVLGVVSARAAAETGLRAGTPVAVGGGDSQCGLVGSGAVRRGRITAVAGTTTPILLVTDAPAIDASRRLWTRCHAVPRQWCLEANAGMTGIAYRWVRDALCGSDKAAAETSGRDPYELMNERAARAPLGAAGVTAMASSLMDARRIDRLFAPIGFFGANPMQPESSGLDTLVRAMMENVAYAVAANVELLEEVAGARVSELRLCGGQTRSRFWSQLQADVLGVSVLVAEGDETTALGAAVCAGVGGTVFANLEEGGEAVSRFETIEPRAREHEQYALHLRRWRELARLREQAAEPREGVTA